MSAYSPLGSLWNRWDLHFHTPSSFDYEDKRISNQQIVDSLIQAGLRVIAITDHHTMDVGRIQELQTLGADKLTVLPGIELRDEHGGEPIHYICIFPEDCALDHVWTMLQGSLGLTAKAIQEKGETRGSTFPLGKGLPRRGNSAAQFPFTRGKRATPLKASATASNSNSVSSTISRKSMLI